MTTVYLSLSAILGIVLIFRIVLILVRDFGKLYVRIHTGGQTQLVAGLTWGVRLGLETGLLIGGALLFSVVGADQLYHTRLSEPLTNVWTVLPALCRSAAFILAAAIVGWSALGVYWAGRWAHGARFFAGFDDPLHGAAAINECDSATEAEKR